MIVEGLTDREDRKINQVRLTARTDEDMERLSLWLDSIASGESFATQAIGVEVEIDNRKGCE